MCQIANKIYEEGREEGLEQGELSYCVKILKQDEEGNVMVTKGLPLGNPDFQEIREKDQYYVDKTLMIEDFLSSGDKVTLITRPRRFGKTLNMSMLSCFCDQDMD